MSVSACKKGRRPGAPDPPANHGTGLRGGVARPTASSRQEDRRPASQGNGKPAKPRASSWQDRRPAPQTKRPTSTKGPLLLLGDHGLPRQPLPRFAATDAEGRRILLELRQARRGARPQPREDLFVRNGVNCHHASRKSRQHTQELGTRRTPKSQSWDDIAHRRGLVSSACWTTSLRIIEI